MHLRHYVLAFDVHTMAQCQHNRPDHGHQQDQTRRLEEIDIFVIDQLPQSGCVMHLGHIWGHGATHGLGVFRYLPDTECQ